MWKGVGAKKERKKKCAPPLFLFKMKDKREHLLQVIILNAPLMCLSLKNTQRETNYNERCTVFGWMYKTSSQGLALPLDLCNKGTILVKQNPDICAKMNIFSSMSAFYINVYTSVA